MARPRYLRLGQRCRTLKILHMRPLRLWHPFTGTLTDSADDRHLDSCEKDMTFGLVTPIYIYGACVFGGSRFYVVDYLTQPISCFTIQAHTYIRRITVDPVTRHALPDTFYSCTKRGKWNSFTGHQMIVTYIEQMRRPSPNAQKTLNKHG